MELNQIPQNPNNWGNVADLLNENSGKIEAETAKLNNATTKFKGYFSTSTALSAKWPSPLVGDTAWVGATYPGVVYRCDVAGAWLATTDVPSVATVDLSEYYKLSDVLDKLKLDVSTAQTLTNIGEMAWNTETETVELKISNEVTMSIGQELFVKAKNTETTSILNGTPVYISGAQGGLKQIKKASNLTDIAEKTIGLATQDITASDSGIITTMGEVHSLNTSAFAEGALIWLGANGALTATKPVDAPYHIIIGICTRSHATEGSIFVSVKESYRAQIAQLRSYLSSKIEINSINIIDYDKCSLNKGLGVFGEVVDNTPDYTISDYIPVKQGDEIIANVWDTSAISWSPYAVYDINLNYIRSIRNNSEPSHYVYQEGDAYIRCMFINTAIQYMYGNYGSTLLPYQKYNPIKAYFDMENQKDRDDITGLQNEVDVVGNSVESMVQLHPYNYVINQDGDIVLQNLEICPILKVRVTPFTKYKLDDVRPIVVATGTYYKYAWYSSYEIIGSTTFISGELGTAPFDEHIIKTITPPAGAMALVVMAYYGTENIKKEQNSANSMLELYFKRNVIDKFFNFPFKQVINGNQKIYGTAYSLNNFGVNPAVDGVSPYENTLSLSGRGWCYFGPFNPDNDEIIHISFNVSRLVKAEGEDISIWVSKAVGSAGADQRSLGVIDHIGDYHIYLDPTYYRIYHGYSDTFYIWIYKHDYAIETCVIENFRVYAMTDSEEFNNIEGVTSDELFKSTDEGIGLLNKAIDKKKYLVAPNGNKYDYGVDNNGNIIAIPVIPNKAAFFGNSLMFGNVYFGMDASDENSDFYAKVNAYIKTLNPNFTANRYSSVSFETIDSLANIDSVVNSTVNNLNGDEDLIVIQAGDNTTDAQATSIMPTSCMKLLAAIKNRCPNARICWPAIWYATIDKMNNVRNACDRYGAVIATIGELNIPENRGTIGSVIDYGEGHSVESILNDVISVGENSPTNITITFTYGGNTYTQTIDVNSYALNGTTLVFTAMYGICTVGAGHPGNRGMKAIASKILYSMGICDDENAYPLD